MAKAMDVADMIITLASDQRKPVSNLKLQKTMYFLNVIHLLENKRPLIDDEVFEKWDYGPVIPSVYKEYSFNGGAPINKPVDHFFFYKEGETYGFDQASFNVDSYRQTNANDFNFIKGNLGFFLNQKPFYLVDKSHEERQWQDKSTLQYDDRLTISYYREPSNQFWKGLGR